MNNIVITGTIIAILELIIVVYQAILISIIKKEGNNIKDDNHRFKNDMMKMYSENVSDIIIQNQRTLEAINKFINEPK